ncbi:MAG: SpvB/TcaC N-terminal domain-containing protein, partial [Chloroflexota bacterium]
MRSKTKFVVLFIVIFLATTAFSPINPTSAHIETTPMWDRFISTWTSWRQSALPDYGLSKVELGGMQFKPAANANTFDDFSPPTSVELSLKMASSTGIDPTMADIGAELLFAAAVNNPSFDAAISLQDEMLFHIEGSTFDNPITLEYIAQYDAETSHFDGSSAEMLRAFEVNIVDQVNGQIHHEFDRPVRVVVDLREHGINLDEMGGAFFLAYRDPEQPERLIDVPVTVYDSKGLVAAEVTHFSEWTTGWRPDQWSLQWDLPVPSEFSGAATYSYPIQVPPGRNGLQPNIALNYSSSSLNGAMRALTAGRIAAGWSITEIAIVRTNIEADETDLAPVGDEESFRLVLNGTGHKLKRSSDNEQINGGDIYYVEDAPSIRVVAYRSGERDFSYFHVQTGDGTTYQLGSFEDARTIQELWSKGQGEESDVNNLTRDDMEIIEWHVDMITDAFGNRIQYTYKPLSEVVDSSEGEDGSIRIQTRAAAIDKIYYNFSGQASLNQSLLSTQPALPTGSAATVIEYKYNLSEEFDPHDPKGKEDKGRYLKQIIVSHGGQEITTYDINSEPLYYEPVTQNSEDLAKIDYCPDGSDRRITMTSVVKSITKTGHIGSVDKAAQPTSFEYIPLPNGSSGFNGANSGEGCFFFYRLNKVNNGYGGSVKFVYAQDGRQKGTYDSNSERVNSYPDIARNYWVKEMIVSDGQGQMQRTAYSRFNACYTQEQPDWIPNLEAKHGHTPETNACTITAADVQDQSNDIPEYGNLTGWQYVTIDQYNFANDRVLQRQEIEFEMIYADGLGTVKNRKTFTSPDENSLDNDGLIQEVIYNYHDFKPRGVSHRPLEMTVTKTYDVNHSTKQEHITTYEYTNESFRDFGLPTSVTTAYVQSSQGATNNLRGSLTTYNYDHEKITGGYWWIPRVVKEEKAHVYASNNANIVNPKVDDYELVLSKTDDVIETTFSYGTNNSQLRPSRIKVGLENSYRETATEYDSYGNVISASVFNDGVEQKTETFYDPDYNLYPIRVENPLGHCSYFTISGFRSEDCAGDAVAAQNTGPFGTLERVVAPHNTITRYEYDALGRLIRLFEPGDTSTATMSYVYNDNASLNGVKTLSIEARPINGIAPITVQFYDGLGRVIISETRGAQVEPDSGGSDGNRTVIAYSHYDEMGQVTKQSIPIIKGVGSPVYTNYTYHYTLNNDDLKMPGDVQVIAPDGSKTKTLNAISTWVSINNDKVLNSQQITNAEGHRMGYFSNGAGQLVLAREWEGSNTQPYQSYADTVYQYDIQGNLEKISRQEPDPNGNGALLSRQTWMKYDVFGQKTFMLDPDMGVWTYRYDGVGNLESQTDARGNTLCFDYDLLNRLTTKWEVDADACGAPLDSNDSGWLASYEYDKFLIFDSHTYGNRTGQLTRVTWAPNSSQNQELFGYDAQGRMIRHNRMINGIQFKMEYENFDDLNRPTDIIYPDGERIAVTYDKSGEESLIAGNDTLVHSVKYNERGQMSYLDRGSNGVDTDYRYYGASENYRLNHLEHLDLTQHTYSYDNLGNITKIVESGLDDYTQDFFYDHLNRLTTAVGNSYVEQYAYDKLGNIDSVTSDGQVIDYTYWSPSGGSAPFVSPNQQTHPDHVLPHAVSTVGDQEFKYDGNGNMVVRKDDTGDYTQVFDTENRLIRVTEHETGNITNFFYDASGQRTMTENSDGTISYYPFPTYEEVHGLEITVDESAEQSNQQEEAKAALVSLGPVPAGPIPAASLAQQSQGEHVIFDDALSSDWAHDDDSRADVYFDSAEQVYAGSGAIKLQINRNWGSLYLDYIGEDDYITISDEPENEKIRFYVYATQPNDRYQLKFRQDGSSNQKSIEFTNQVTYGEWSLVEIPLSDVQSSITKFNTLIWQGKGNTPAPTFYIDNISLILDGGDTLITPTPTHTPTAQPPSPTPTFTPTNTPISVPPSPTPTFTPTQPPTAIPTPAGQVGSCPIPDDEWEAYQWWGGPPEIVNGEVHVNGGLPLVQEPAVVGQTYTYSGKYRSPAGVVGNTGIVFIDANGNQMDAGLVRANLTPSTSMSDFSISTTAPSGAVDIRVWLYSGDGVTTVFDDQTLTADENCVFETAPPPNAALIVNRSRVEIGQSFTLTWDSSNASVCSGSWTNANL